MLCLKCGRAEARVAGVCAECAGDMRFREAERFIRSSWPVEEQILRLRQLLEFQEEWRQSHVDLT